MSKSFFFVFPNMEADWNFGPQQRFGKVVGKYTDNNLEMEIGLIKIKKIELENDFWHLTSLYQWFPPVKAQELLKIHFLNRFNMAE